MALVNRGCVIALTPSKTSDMARYTLERIPGSTADMALQKALPKTSGKVKVSIINTLGRRGDTNSVSSLGSLIYRGRLIKKQVIHHKSVELNA